MPGRAVERWKRGRFHAKAPARHGPACLQTNLAAVACAAGPLDDCAQRLGHYCTQKGSPSPIRARAGGASRGISAARPEEEEEEEEQESSVLSSISHLLPYPVPLRSTPPSSLPLPLSRRSPRRTIPPIAPAPTARAFPPTPRHARIRVGRELRSKTRSAARGCRCPRQPRDTSTCIAPQSHMEERHIRQSLRTFGCGYLSPATME